MKITIIGASAGIGLATVRQALARGHAVAAMARNTNMLADAPLLTKVSGSSESVSDLTAAICHADAIIITIGTKDKKKTTLFTASAKALIAAYTELNMHVPVLVITGFGAGESSRFLNCFMRSVIWLFLRDQYKDKTAMERLFSQSTLQWEMVRPGMLTDEKLTNHYKIFPDLRKGMRVKKISRNDVADFLLNEAENPKLLFHYPTLTS